MPAIVHIVTTRNFSGVERYVCDTANETADRGWNVAVVGGDGERMPAELGEAVRWLPGATTLEALRSLRRIGRHDVCHVHMTAAETVAIAATPFHRAPIVSTRHFARRRGSTPAGRLAAPWIRRRLALQIAVSDFVARHLEAPPDAVVPNGVPSFPPLWRPSSRIVLVLQRLEVEKDTMVALRAWQRSELASEGWSLRVVGDGSQRPALEQWAADAGLANVTFTGATTRVADELAGAGALLATASGEPFGLAVVEAMAAGVPVAAAAAGGHLETIGRVPDAPMFPPHDVEAAAMMLRAILDDEERARMAALVRRHVEDELTIDRHVTRLLAEYERVLPAYPREVGRGEVTTE